jgi:hypothetical protein
MRVRVSFVFAPEPSLSAEDAIVSALKAAS